MEIEQELERLEQGSWTLQYCSEIYGESILDSRTSLQLFAVRVNDLICLAEGKSTSPVDASTLVILVISVLLPLQILYIRGIG